MADPAGQDGGGASSPSSPSPSLGKVRLEVPSSSSSSSNCPFHNWFYLLLALLALTYAAYLQDREGFRAAAEARHLGAVPALLAFIETYSPFTEFLQSDEEFLAKVREEKERRDNLEAQKSKVEKDMRGSGERVFTKAELAQYDGSADAPGLYLALLGVVYDVSSGRQHYGAGGGYSFFAGRDASRAYVTGDFEEAGLVEGVAGLAGSDYLGLLEWQEFYEKDYRRVGVLEGLYYTREGEVTAAWRQVQGWAEEARREAEVQDVERNMFPPCNVEWTQAEGSRFWCTPRSGGVVREWAGVPRRLFYPGREARCACVRPRGAPSTDPGDRRADRGDLDNPHLQEYAGCEPDSRECRSKED